MAKKLKEREVVVEKPEPVADGRILVRATALGYYDHVRRKIGDEFMIASSKHLSAVWMKRVEEAAAEEVPAKESEAKPAEDDKAREAI